MPDFLQNITPFNAFLGGLIVGLLVAIFVWFSQLMRRHAVRKELKKTREHLHTHMTISAKGQETMQAEINKLKEQNENMRVSMQTLQSKPGREDQRSLQVYDRAIRIMNTRAPGFSAAWERASDEAEQEIQNAERGIGGFFRRTFSSSGSSKKSLPANSSGSKKRHEGIIEDAVEGQ